MPVWSQPQDLKTWIRRGISFRGSIVLLAALAIVFTEMRFNWVELMVGRYLAITNAHRPESGSVWEQGHLKKVATQTLEQMVTEQLSAQREAREADSLTELIEGLATGQGIMVSSAQFRSLYAKLPDGAARELFSPILMLRISAEKSWERSYLERGEDQVTIYLLDGGNNVLAATDVSQQQLQTSENASPLIAGGLDEQPEFAGRIYPADRFFMALDTLTPEAQRGVLPRPEVLLAAQGVPARVGFSDEVHSDLIRIGIEMHAPHGRQILTVMGREWAVWQVRMLLDPRLSRPDSGRDRWHFGGGGDK